MKTQPRSGRFSLGFGHAVFLAVLAMRLVALLRLTQSSMLIPARGDMHFYNDWARQILHGQSIQHLAFYGLPGYAYFLAFLARVFGENPFLPGLLQALADAGTATLIYLILSAILKSATPASGTVALVRAVPVIGALAWGFFVPAEAYAVVLMPTALYIFVFWLVVWRCIRGEAGPRLPELFGLAVLVGLTATAVATILALVPLMVAASMFRKASRSWSRLPAQLGVLLLGLVIGTSPCWVHNYLIARDPVALSAHSGINFWIGNNPDANGYPRFPPGLHAGQAAMLQDSIDQAEISAGRPLKHAEVSRYWSDKARNFISTQFGDWVKLMGVKLRNFWSAFQYDDLSIITILREQGVIFPGVFFGAIAALAIPGIVFVLGVAPLSRWIFAAVLLAMIAVLVVFVTERYRLVVVPGLIVFAALGLSMLWQKIGAGEFRSAALYLIILLPSTGFVAWPQRDPSLWALDSYNAGWQALESNDLAPAEQKLAIAHAYVPDNSETLFAIGNLRLAQNDRPSASNFYHAVLKLDPRHKGAFNNLGVIALEADDYETAAACFSHAVEIDPRNAKSHFLLAKALVAKNDVAAARSEIDTAISLKENQSEFLELKNKIANELPR